MSDLTDQQQTAFDELYDRLAGGDRFVTMRGYAGTGKTHLAGRLIDRLVAEEADVWVCAPTHKAAQVLRTKIDGGETRPQTLHAFLGLRLKPDGQGGYVLEPEPDRLPPWGGIVVVDEASMIGAAEWEHVAQAPGLQWLFVGDPAQLPPVGEGSSPVFEFEGPELDEIVRQAAGNPILQLAEQVRQTDRPALRPCFRDDAGVAVTRNAHSFLESALRAFDTDAFRDDATFARILAYRNRTVRHYNDAVRTALYGADAERFVEGEWLMAQETWFDGGVPWLFNSEEVRVKKVKEDEAEAEHDLSTWKVWRLRVKGLDDTRSRGITVLHEDEHQRYEDELDRLRDVALARPRRWKDYYAFREHFARVDYAYSTTVHKAQGSTFDTVFVDHRDVQACRGPERRALLYVAVSRPARRLALLQ